MLLLSGVLAGIILFYFYLYRTACCMPEQPAEDTKCGEKSALRLLEQQEQREKAEEESSQPLTFRR